MSKTVKYILFAALALLVVVFGIPLIMGIFSGTNPNKAIQYAQQKQAENKEIYLPIGYTLSSKAEPQTSDYGTLYVTQITSQSNNIRVIQSPKSTRTCKVKSVTLSGQEVCYYNVGESPGQPNNKVLLWDKGNNTFQLETNDVALSDEELGKIVASF